MFLSILSLSPFKKSEPETLSTRDSEIIESFRFVDEDDSSTRFDLKFFHEFPKIEMPGSFIVPFIEGG